MPSPLSCTVRGCGATLERGRGVFACASGHAFDVARSGYVNLLQPQHRRSATPGDSREAVLARKRLADAGFDEELRDAALDWLVERALPGSRPAAARLAEVGSGAGTLLARLAHALPLEAYGVDLASFAARTAAVDFPHVTWIVDNADRRLCFGDESLDALLTIKAPKNPAEFARVLAPGAQLLVGVPGVDDLVELRTATASGGLRRDPAERALAALTGAFTLLRRVEVRSTVRLAPDLLRDVLRSGYRGERASERARAEQLDAMDVTSSTTLLELARKG
jgi:23S rRNA (guanine745-N1)-methyltransferase